MTDATSERSAIVAWLRSKKRMDFMPLPDEIIPAHPATDDHGYELGYTVPEARRPMKRLATAMDYADAIEAGRHITEKNDGE